MRRLDLVDEQHLVPAQHRQVDGLFGGGGDLFDGGPDQCGQMDAVGAGEAEQAVSERVPAALIDAVSQLLSKGGPFDPFATEYRRALQDNPDVVMAHARTMGLVGRPAAQGATDVPPQAG